MGQSSNARQEREAIGPRGSGGGEASRLRFGFCWYLRHIRISTAFDSDEINSVQEQDGIQGIGVSRSDPATWVASVPKHLNEPNFKVGERQ